MVNNSNNLSAIEAKRQDALSLVKKGNITGAIATAKATLKLDPSSKLMDEVTELYLTLNPEMADAVTENKGAEIAPPQDNTLYPKTPLFSNLPQLELLEVINAANHVSLPKDGEVFSTDDDGRSIFVITSGSADIICLGQDGQEIICSTLKEGDFFGEFGYFGEEHRTASVKAASDLELLELTRTNLRLLIDSHHSIGDVLFDFYKERVLDRLLAVSNIFKHLSITDRKEVLELVDSEVFIDGMDIISEGDEGDTMYLIKMGSAEAWTLDKDGKKKVLAELKDGDSFGELALILDTARKATVTALTPIELIVFSRPTLHNILSKYPEIQSLFDNEAQERLCGIEQLREKLPPSSI
ncbi:MAG: cyclic nucleotide-binding domain-containing protein [Proteobacteria bacterium]|nr:cyclic nucleotide-binding domain-containing protein [Pseudomonadota bacterium]